MLGNELGFYATYMSDRYGFNNPDDIYDKPRIGHGVVLLGDSYVQGYAVMPGDDVAGRLRAKGFHTINLGCGGNGPLAELAAYVEYGRFLRPDTVVLLYYEGNDLYDLDLEWDSSLRQYLDDGFSQHLMEREEERLRILHSIAEVQSMFWNAEIFYRLVTLRQIRNRLQAVVSPRQFDTEVQHFQIVINELRDRLEQESVSLLVVYLPEGSMMAGGRQDDCKTLPARCKNEIIKILDNHEIRVLDFEKVLNNMDEPFSVFPYRQGKEVLGHLNPAGYRILADAIAQQLAEMKHHQTPPLSSVATRRAD
jgi:hypothetical protein